MKKDPVKTCSIRIEETTLLRLKKFIGKAGKISASADIAINEYLDRQNK